MRSATTLCSLVALIVAPNVQGFTSLGPCSVKNASFVHRKLKNTISSARNPHVSCVTNLSMTQTPISPEPIIEIDESLREEDPIEFISQEVQVKMDANSIINTVILALIGLAVLNQFATVDADVMRGWSAQEMAIRIPIDNWNGYSAILEQSPILTKAATSATVYTIGDFIAQRTEGRTMGELDRGRILRSLLAGLVGHGPMSHVWYSVSDNIFENVLHLQGWSGTIIKVVIDQSFWGPIWNNTYILLLGLMKFNKLEDIFSEMKRTTIPLIVSGLKLWPLAHLVTYGLIPLENRLLWVDMIEIIWVTILATAAAGGEAEEEGEEKSLQ